MKNIQYRRHTSIYFKHLHIYWQYGISNGRFISRTSVLIVMVSKEEGFILILSIHLLLGLTNALFLSGFRTIILCIFLTSPMHATCPVHIINLHFKVAKIQPLATSSLLVPNILINLFSSEDYPKVSGLAAWSENCKWYQFSATRCSCIAIL
jgi:hypothetical protein